MLILSSNLSRTPNSSLVFLRFHLEVANGIQNKLSFLNFSYIHLMLKIFTSLIFLHFLSYQRNLKISKCSIKCLTTTQCLLKFFFPPHFDTNRKKKFTVKEKHMLWAWEAKIFCSNCLN